MRKYLQQEMARPALTVDGFRSTFRDWAAECTNFPREIAEAALAHAYETKPRPLTSAVDRAFGKNLWRE